MTASTAPPKTAAPAPANIDALLDGEICCGDKYGALQFNELLFRRGAPVFFAFDLLYVNGMDWRERPLIEF